MIFRVEKNKNYIVMSNYHLRDKNLSLKAKGLLSWMLSNNDDWDYSIAGIVACCKEGETTINTALRELQEYGYVKIIKVKPDKDNNRIHYEYNVYEKPQDIDSQGVESLVLENQVQRNTNIINTKKRNINNTKVLLEVNSSEQSTEKPKKKNLYEKCSEMIDSFSENEKIRELLKDYLSMRLSMRESPIYANQWKALLNKLKELGKDDADILDIIRQSLEKGYKSFFPVAKGYNYGGGRNTEMQRQMPDAQSFKDRTEKEEYENKLVQEAIKNGRRAYY